MQNLAEFTKFPLTLYDRLVRAVLTWVVPFACVSYYPGLVLLGRSEARPWMAVSAPLAAAGMLAVAAIIWRRGLARNQGTGH